MPEPFPVPIGLRLNQAARTVERAFDEALGAAGGTLPVWLILLNLKIHRPANQRELAEAVGIREATLTHHLNAMDARGLIARTRDATNRRVGVVTLTEAGEAAFLRLRDAAQDFDARLRAGLTEADLAILNGLLGKLAANVGPAAPDTAPDTTPPWSGLAERQLPERGSAGRPRSGPGGQQREVAAPDDRGKRDRARGPGHRRRTVDPQQGLLQVRVRGRGHLAEHVADPRDRVGLEDSWYRVEILPH
jgi:MarR family transcriptional regulator for hemolysin